MTYSKTVKPSASGLCQDVTTTLVLSEIEMHFLTQALWHYARQAYAITGNIHHAEGVDKLHDQVLDAYCDKP